MLFHRLPAAGTLYVWVTERLHAVAGRVAAGRVRAGVLQGWDGWEEEWDMRHCKLAHQSQSQNCATFPSHIC